MLHSARACLVAHALADVSCTKYTQVSRVLKSIDCVRVLVRTTPPRKAFAQSLLSPELPMRSPHVVYAEHTHHGRPK